MTTAAPRLSFAAGQEEFDTWYTAHLARASDPENDFEFVDLNDMVMVFAASRKLVDKYPLAMPAFDKWVPEGVELAGHELGMFMGINWIANKVGADPEVARQTLVDLFSSPRVSETMMRIDLGGEGA